SRKPRRSASAARSPRLALSTSDSRVARLSSAEWQAPAGGPAEGWRAGPAEGAALARGRRGVPADSRGEPGGRPLVGGWSCTGRAGAVVGDESRRAPLPGLVITSSPAAAVSVVAGEEKHGTGQQVRQGAEGVQSAVRRRHPRLFGMPSLKLNLPPQPPL